jgi:D-alanyl-D-alanine carboxypeptidase
MGEAMSCAIDTIVESELAASGTGAAVAVFQGGELIHHRGYGLANVELGVAVEADTVFPICSISKPITATLVMMLMEEGLLDLDAPVRRYLPAFDAANDTITLRHLLTHTSGLANYNATERFLRHEGRLALPAAERLAFLLAQPTEFAPGERYAYCNTGYVLLGFVIEAVTGRGFREVLGERVFAPCGMDQSLLLDDHAIVPKRASGYELGPRGLQNAWHQAVSWRGGAGGIASTAGDLVRWMQAFEAGRLIGAVSRAEMLRPVMLNDGSTFDYGLGWGTGAYHGREAYLHTGGGFGYSCELVRFPQADTTVVLLTNLYRFAFHRVGMAIARQVLGLPEPVSRPQPLGAAEAQTYAGTYRSLDGVELQLQAAENGMAGLVHCGDHLFHARDDIEMLYRFSGPGLAGFGTVHVNGPLFPPFPYHRWPELAVPTALSVLPRGRPADAVRGGWIKRGLAPGGRGWECRVLFGE